MSKNDQQIMVVPTEILFPGGAFQGFSPRDNFDYESLILKNFQTMRRGNAEEDPRFKQPIGYATLVNLETKQAFAYKRASNQDYHEKRLRGKWSWGFGGHIEPNDSRNGNPIRESVLREVTEEELEVYGNKGNPSVLGYINDDSNDVGRVHFGILYVIPTYTTKVLPRDPEIEKVEIKTLSELEELCSNPEFEVETWSQIALEPLRKLL